MKTLPQTATYFRKGDRVRYTGAAGSKSSIFADIAGKTATVRRPIKTRNTVHIEFDGDTPANQRQFDANPANLKLLSDEAMEQLARQDREEA